MNVYFTVELGVRAQLSFVAISDFPNVLSYFGGNHFRIKAPFYNGFFLYDPNLSDTNAST